ncbi:MAG: hypothetical protein NT033_01510 [Candidatus Omnitrophica bacterium]|nr:hypothetical protein [Candidatus Omnitrophota bacterium]
MLKLQKVLIIKLGAMGDVVRTTPLLRILKGDIYWVANKESIPLLPVDDHMLKRVIDISSAEEDLRNIDFDLVLSLDDDFETARLATSIRKDSLIGSFIDNAGRVSYTDSSSEWFDMGIISKLGKTTADRLKKENTKTYQEIFFKMLDKEFQGEEYLLNTDSVPPNKNSKKPVIGIEERSGERWPSKKWNKFQQLKDSLLRDGFKVNIFQQRPTLGRYIEDICKCDLVVTGDSLALHIALALKKKVIAIFICTSPAEIFDYDRMIKVVSPLLAKVFYSREYNFEAVDAISLESVYNVIKKLTGNKV